MGFIWDESADEFATIKAATEDGTTAGNVTITDYVGLHVGAITADDTSVFSGSIELGHATDTTIARSGSGAITVEGTAVLLAGDALTGTTIDATTDFTIGDTIITDGVVTDSSGLSIVAATTVTGALTVGVDDTGHDVKFFGASAGAYMMYDQSEDQLILIGPSADAAGSSGKLLLGTSQTDVRANDILGQIDFKAPAETGTDAITVAASIAAIAQDTFSASVNATDMIFYTGHSEVATEKFRITSQGELGVGGANYGTDGQVLTSTGAGTAPAWEDVATGGATVSYTSASVNEPVISITNTHADATAGILKFVKDPGAGQGADNDVLGTITFYGTDAGNNAIEELARIQSTIVEADHGSEAAAMKFYVAENDATVTAGLQLLGVKDADGEIDVTIGAGAASTTIIAGTLTMGSTAAMTNAGLVAVANQSNITGVSTITSGVWNGTAIASGYIADNGVTLAKMAGLARGKIIVGDASGDPAALAVGSENQVLSIDGSGDAVWAAAGGVSGAQTGITTILNAGAKLGRDSQNLIDFATTDNKIILRVNNVDEVELVENALSPITNDGVALGSTSLGWSDLHIASAGVINWVNGEMTITETSADILTVAGGTLATAALTTSTIVASGIVKTDDTTAATTIADGSLQTDGGLSVTFDAVIGDDLILISDAAVLSLGIGADVKLTHDNATGGTLSGTPLVVDSLAASALADDTYTGVVLGFISNGSIAIGQAVYVHTADGRVAIADANALATMPAIGVAVTAASDGGAIKILTHGIYNDSDGFSGDLTEGVTMYLGEDVGTVNATIPDAAGDFVQVMGIAVGPRDVFINPSLDIIERA